MQRRSRWDPGCRPWRRSVRVALRRAAVWESLLAHPFAAPTHIPSPSPHRKRRSALTHSVAQIHIERGVGESNLPSPSILWQSLTPPPAPLASPVFLVALYQRLRCLQVRDNEMQEGGNPDESPVPNQLGNSSPTLAKHAFPGSFLVPGGLERMGTLLSIKPQHLLKSGGPEPLNTEEPRRKMWHQNRPRNHTGPA